MNVCRVFSPALYSDDDVSLQDERIKSRTIAANAAPVFKTCRRGFIPISAARRYRGRDGKETRLFLLIGFNARVKVIYLFVFGCLFGIGCATPQTAPFTTALNWVTKSSEYQAVCQQTYAAAWEKMAPAARAANGPWVIVMDLDETVLDNSNYQRQLESSGQGHSQAAWAAWVARSDAGLVPGAKEFIAKVRTLPRARIVFLSNRYTTGLDATRANLKKLGLTADSDIFLLRREKADTKAIRQREVLEGSRRMAPYGAHRVVAWFGDAAHDFPKDAKLKWGTEKFMLPNPVYGSW
jgi:5'-nucleotidase (lipoprotein e(P4) family)